MHFFTTRLVQSRWFGCASGGLAGGTAIGCPEDLSQRTIDDGSVLHDLRQRRLLLGRQGLEGAGCTAKSAAQEELRADQRPAKHLASGRSQIAGHQVACDQGDQKGTRGRLIIVRRPRASSWARMPVAVVSQIGSGCGIVRAVSLCTVSNRIIGSGLTVGDGTSDDGACSEPAEHCGTRSVVPAMVPAVIVRSAVPAAVLHGLQRLRGSCQPLGPGHRHGRRCGRGCWQHQRRRPEHYRCRNNFPRLHLNTPVSCAHVRAGSSTRPRSDRSDRLILTPEPETRSRVPTALSLQP
jgi:hypothetical protein